MPTDVDVRRIRDKYPDDSLAGEIASKEDIAELIGCDVLSHRFRTVTARWRRLVEAETSKIIGLGEGIFHVLSDVEKVDLACGKQRHAFRAVKRSVKVSSLVDRAELDDVDRKRIDHVDMIATRVGEAAQLRDRQMKTKKLS
jgi:hypothetical protein